MAIVTIIGSGMMGSALAFPARENGHEVRLVGTHLDADIIDECRKCNRHPKFTEDFPAGVKFYKTEETDEAIRGSTFVICGVSSFGVEWFGRTVLPRIPKGMPVLSVTKGLSDDEAGGLKNYPEVWSDLCPGANICAIGGPCTSYELVAHDQTEVTFCGTDRAALTMMRDVMQTDYYHVTVSDDVAGTESAVALKNGYALGIALSIGINERLRGSEELHFNSQAALFMQSVKEMKKLIRLLGGRESALDLGAGDLYVTVYGGRTRKIGILLGRGLSFGEAMDELAGVTLESVVVSTRVARAVRVRAARGELSLEDFPLLMHVDEIINRGAAVDIPWDKFTAEDFAE